MKKLFRVLSFLLVFVLFLTSCKSAVNGTYEGKARGHNGDVVIDVSFENNKIKKVSLKVDAPPQVDVQEKKSIFMDIGTIMNLMFPMLGMNLFLIYGMKSEQNQAGIYVYSGLFMAVMSAVCSILWLMISRKYEKREQQKKVNKERLAYRRYLNKKSEYIKVQYERVYKVLQSRYLRADCLFARRSF